MLPIDYNKWYYKVIYFFIANQIALKRGLITFLIVLCMLGWGFSLKNWADYFLDTAKHEAAMSQQVAVDYGALKECQELTDNNIVLPAMALPSANFEGRYDLVAKITNPNTRCLAELDYYFLYAGETSEQIKHQKDFLLPGQTKYLFGFAEEVSSSFLNEVQLVIEKQNWRYIKNLEKMALIDKLEIKDRRYDILAGISRASFAINNGTGYNLWQVGCQVVLLSGNEPVAVNYITVNNLLAGAEQEVQASWFRRIDYGGVEIEVIPDLNVFADNILVETETGPGIPQGWEE